MVKSSMFSNSLQLAGVTPLPEKGRKELGEKNSLVNDYSSISFL